METTGGLKCFGTKPLKDIVKNLRATITIKLNALVAQHDPPPGPSDHTIRPYELPELSVFGIITPVQKMTQGQLRSFIPLILKYSTGRVKPCWGNEIKRPPWWPKGIAWANIKTDVRSEDEKLKISWTEVLRQIVINCYKYHGREDLLLMFNKEDPQKHQQLTQINSSQGEGPIIITGEDEQEDVQDSQIPPPLPTRIRQAPPPSNNTTSIRSPASTPPRPNNATVPVKKPDVFIPPPPPQTIETSKIYMSSTDVAPDPRSALLDAIRSGKTLKPVNSSNSASACNPTLPNSRNELLDQIRQGTQLKPVQPIENKNSNKIEMDGLTEALARALANRARVNHIDSSTDDDSSADENSEWED